MNHRGPLVSPYPVDFGPALPPSPLVRPQPISLLPVFGYEHPPMWFMPIGRPSRL